MKTATGAGILLVTHDLGVVAEICDRVCVMYAGRVAEIAYVTTLFDNPLHPYTWGLLNAVRTLDKGEVTAAIKGQVAPATDYPTGCRFHPRCPKAMKICPNEVPLPQKIQGSVVACHLY